MRVDTIDELFDVASLMANQPVPAGRRVVIVTNGGGPGILAADACEQRGLPLPDFSEETTGKLKEIARRDIRFSNPLDLTAGATAAEFEAILRVLAQDAGNDAVIVIFIPPVIVGLTSMEDAIRNVSPHFRRRGKPLLACFLGQRGVRRQLGTRGKFVPCYPFPEDAVLALAKAAEYGQWRRRPEGKIPRIRGLRRSQADRIIGRALTRSVQRPLWLSPDEVAGLLGCYGIRTVETLRARTADEAAAIASAIGFPVAVKLD